MNFTSTPHPTAQAQRRRHLVPRPDRRGPAHRAEQLLATSVSIETIARQLGYAETASFTHAFIRWTGLSPVCFGAKRGVKRC